LWLFGVCLREIGIVIDASGAYKGESPRCGREGVVSGMMINRKSNKRMDGAQEVIR
jgi:hypothetical protein